MTHLISILLACLLFFGFLLLTLYESRRGTRFFAGYRYKLDMKIARAQFLIDHIDWGAFTAHVTRTSLQTVAHDITHGTLLFVRSVERFLTRAVRALRTRRDGGALDGPKAGAPTIVEPAARRLRVGDIIRRTKGE
ncbi:MAG TPA: hypothetical protein VGB97_01720 [Candidatus Paceibacterota bacterium]|jgi:hypothetical protein